MPYPYYNAASPSITPYNGSYMSTPYNYTPQIQTPSSAVSGGIQWVQGESGAKSYPVGSGTSAILMDSESSRFFIKTVDASGMPQPLRIFKYEEVKAEAVSATPAVEYVTKAEFEKAIAELTPKKAVKKDE